MIIKKDTATAKQIAALQLPEEDSGSLLSYSRLPSAQPAPSAPTRGSQPQPHAPPSEEIASTSQRLLQQAQERSTLIEKDAYEKGFIQGERAGRELAEKKSDALLKRYAATLDELGRLKVDMLARVEKDVVRLAVAIARRILQREIQIDPEVVLTMTRIALSRISEKATASIRLNPADFKVLLENKGRLGPANEIAGITLIEDHSITRGGCLIDTEMGSVDARIDEQVREIERGILGT